MRILLLALVLGLALVAAPVPLAIDDAAACQGQGCPVSYELCGIGFHLWIYGKDYGPFCSVGP